MVTRGQTQVNSLFKDFAFAFPASDAIETNNNEVLIDHNLEIFEVGKL